MKNITKFAVAACAILAGTLTSYAGGEGWSHDFKAATKQAASEKKDMLVDFTGSDWCGWCIKLNKEVFSHQEFKDGVKDGYVLVELDYPRDKSKLSDETIAQNEELKDEYSIKGYPTILLMDGQGRPFAKTGYRQGGPVEYVKHLKELSELRAERDKAFDSAAKLEGVEKAKALVAALQSLQLDETLVAKFYAGEIAAIKAADPSDESGYAKEIELKGKFSEFQKNINKLASEGDFKGALALAEETIATGGFKGEMEQQVSFIKGMIQAELGEMEDALKTLDQAKSIEPGSNVGKRIDMVKAQISKKLEKKKAEEPAAE